MNTTFKIVRAILLVVTILPVTMMIAANQSFDDFMEDLWG